MVWVVPLSELNIVTKYLDEQFNQNDIGVKQWFVGDYMTALDMQGFYNCTPSVKN